MRSYRRLWGLLLLGVVLCVWVARSSISEAPAPETAAEPPCSEVGAPSPAPPSRSLAARDSIMETIGGDSASYSVYLWYAGDGEPLIINDTVRRSASMIKVFIMACAMDEARQGHLALDATLTLKSSDKVGGAGILAGFPTGRELSIQRLIELMITESDNTATNILIDYLGRDKINAYIAAQGYSDTRLQRKMMDSAAVAAGRENLTTVRDLGEFFRRLYQRECVAGYDEQMIAVLLGQTDTECLPAALPGASIAHKTGELDGLYDDGGIVYSAYGDFVLVILDDDVARYAAIRKLRAIAGMAASKNL